MLSQPFPRLITDLQHHFLAVELDLNLYQELVDHRLNNSRCQGIKLDNGIQAIAELRSEHLLQDLHTIGGMILVSKTN